ncbi:MAG: hypothetical protein IK139_06015 [Lachnospiraceae bacterium]|nr:hypothetical protein [Lachnospiraceae bacterium]
MINISAVCEREDVRKAIEESFPGVHVYRTVLPHVFRTGYEELMQKALAGDEVVARTFDELGFLAENSYRGKIIGDAYLYSMNALAGDTLKKMGVWRDTAPLELTYGELKDRGMSESELTVYGRIPLMVSAQCVYRNTHEDRCRKDEKNGHTVFITDRTGKELPCVCICRYCYNVIYNSVPLSLHNMIEKAKALDPAAMRLSFTTEDPAEACGITEYYIRLLGNGDAGMEFPVKEYTTGHFRKGAE